MPMKEVIPEQVGLLGFNQLAIWIGLPAKSISTIVEPVYEGPTPLARCSLKGSKDPSRARPKLLTCQAGGSNPPLLITAPA